jgi:hypothetical protein
MATTTNYSWTTPDDTDLVKDGASAIRTLGSAIDTTVFTNAGAAVAKATVDAKGDLLVGTADNTVDRLAVGTDGYTLVADSVEATGLKWVAPAGGGKVLQVVSGTTTTSASSTSPSFVDSGLTASITPSSASSKVLVLLTQFCGKTGDSSTSLRLFRGATQLTEVLYIGDTGDSTSQNLGYALSYLDTPATTSATTYKTQYANGGGVGTAFVQRNSNLSSIVLLEIGA